ncbi:flavin-containing monooxygenase [Hoyosella altamirensis]|uniref:Cation diffusion facilitator CzcD-associated flavoprotein CzcO n=1 Tax=Hoyosella altamirensis TaxID=616997 RepID=A0A839RKU0_9ACTN|nr:NAD(P)/FAD-dependent oxidoreductase [Hoyosella altamirensis]MBB3036919.1 cation diffusion facilitator CzcD-associated flavoprotein CzcO [Hoyosella altamirensis]
MGAARLTHAPSVAIIGTGFGGLGMAIQLKKAGFDNLTLFEKTDDVGGVWRDNDYPGAACDVPSHLYSFSFEPKADWSRRFAPQAEIHEYLRDCARKYGLLPHIKFNTEVRGAKFDEHEGAWAVELADGRTHRADVVITATGQLSRPAYPRIPGLDTFKGEIFHSATWNHDYQLEGKKVGVIGTGASSIQFVPRIAASGAQVELFQRDAAHVIPKPDYAYSRAAVELFRRVPGLVRLSRWATYATLEPRALAFTKFPKAMNVIEWRFKRHLKQTIKDPVLRDKLTPKDPIGCKRILISNEYYQALAQPNVDVVNSGITEITPDGLVTADGVLHEVDAIVLGTGFQATDFLSPMEFTGIEGKTLNEEWREGAEAYLGITVAGFPNLFMLYGPNTNLSHSSIVFMLESQIRYILQGITRLAKGDIKWLDVLPHVQGVFNAQVQKKIGATVWAGECSSWYKTASGKVTNNWPGFTFAYRRSTRTFDENDYHAAPAQAPAFSGTVQS